MRRFFSLFFTLMFVATQACSLGITYADQVEVQTNAGAEVLTGDGDVNSTDTVTCEKADTTAAEVNAVAAEDDTFAGKQVSLENTPIDVVYCYADLWDPTLHRGELDTSIKKDYDNQELKYSLRSVLKNIPWVRKIFIIMPNDKVRFLKEPNEISDRIVYVKNEDVVGFDTNSPHVKINNMWKLKKFGCSNHVIYMDDDYFIGKPLKKSDFFYVENNKVIPYIFSTSMRNAQDVCTVYLKDSQSKIKLIKDKNEGKHPESNGGARYNTLSSYIFLMKYALKKDLISLPGKGNFFHFSYGLNLDELKEIYDFIQESEYVQSSLLAKRRENGALMPGLVYPHYVFNKYARKVRRPSTSYVPLEKCINAKYDVDLFCINNENHKFMFYKDSDFRNARLTMQRLFPDPTPYEIPNLKLDKFDSDEWRSIMQKRLAKRRRSHAVKRRKGTKSRKTRVHKVKTDKNSKAGKPRVHKLKRVKHRKR